MIRAPRASIRRPSRSIPSSARSRPASRSSSRTCRRRPSRWRTTSGTRARSTSSATRRASSSRSPRAAARSARSRSGRCRRSRRSTTSDLELAVELGRRASAALDNALLYAEAQARARATEALEFVDDGVLLVDRDEIVRLLNPAAARTFGVKPAKAIGRRDRRRRPRLADRARPHRRRTRAEVGRAAAGDAAGRREGRRALALDLGRPASPAARSTRSAT